MYVVIARAKWDSACTMLLRSLRPPFAAVVRRFSAEAWVAEAGSTAEKGISTSINGGCGRDTLGRRLMSLVYAKRSAVITLRKWEEDGHSLRKYELNRIVRDLRKLKRYKHALEICEWMTLQKDIKLLSGDYAVHLDLIAKVRGLNSAEKFFEDLPEKMTGPSTCTALLHTYVQNKMSTKAEALMEKMSECGFLKNPLPYNHMLSLYISNRQLEKVRRLISELKKNALPDIVTFNLLLNVCALQDDVETAEEVFLGLKKTKIVPDWVTYSTLTNLYLKMKLPEKAKSALKEMEKMASKKERASFTSLLSLHTNIGDKAGVDRIWEKMRSLFRKMSDDEYTCMMSSLVKLGEVEEAESLYAEWEGVSGREGEARLPNILLAAYIGKNQIEKAEKLYNQMVLKQISPSYTTWELLTWGYLKVKNMEKALEYFNKAVGSVKKWNPDEKLMKEVFKQLEEQGNIEGAEQLVLLLRKAGHVKTETYNSLLRTYEKAGKMPLIVAERMEKDKVEMNEETRRLIRLTSKMCVSEVPRTFS